MKQLNRKFGFWIDEKTIEKLKEIAKSKKSSMSRIVRILIDDAYQVLNSTTNLEN